MIDWSPYHLYRKLFGSDDEIARFLDEIDLYNWLRGVDADKPLQQGVAELSARLPQHAKLIEAYWYRWAETLNGALEDSLAVVSELQARGTPLYVISNWSAETWRHATKNLGLTMPEVLPKENIDGEALLWAPGLRAL